MPYSEMPENKKPLRLKFDSLPGDTAWERLIAWTRRRRLRPFVIYSAVLLALYAFVGYSLYIDAQTGTTFGDELPIFLLMMSVYLTPWVWLLIWIAVPRKHHQIRRFKRMGDVYQIAADLEEDLSSPDNILYQKGGVLVTRRFIVDTSCWSLFVYPLEGLIRYEDTASTPIFYYENGKHLNVRTVVPFQKIKPHIYLKKDTPTPETKQSKSKNLLFIALCVCVCSILAVMLILDEDLESAKRIIGIVPYVIWGLFFVWVIALGGRAFVKNMTLWRQVSAMPDAAGKIRKMEKLYAAGRFNKLQYSYFNQLSVYYYELGDYEKALELARQAAQLSGGTTVITIGGMNSSEICRMNEITYLIMLERIEEAERLLISLDERRYKHTGALYSIKTARLWIAAAKGDASSARAILSQIKVLPHKGTPQYLENVSWHVLLMEAKCDLLDGEKQIAVSKLNDIVTRCTYAPTLKFARKLKDKDDAP